MAKNRGAPLPPAGAGRVYDVDYARVDMPLDVTILADTWFGQMVHWVSEGTPPKRRTRLCREYECDLCRTSPAATWMGYIQAWDEHNAREVVVVLGAETARTLQGYHTQFLGLRGRRLVFARPGSSRMGRVIVGLSAFPATQPVRPPFCLYLTLATVFGCGVRELIGAPCEDPPQDGPRLAEQA